MNSDRVVGGWLAEQEQWSRWASNAARSNAAEGGASVAGVEVDGKTLRYALHTQTEHARYLVEDRHASYVFTVKDNQPGLVQAIDHLPAGAFSPSAPNR